MSCNTEYCVSSAAGTSQREATDIVQSFLNSSEIRKIPTEIVETFIRNAGQAVKSYGANQYIISEFLRRFDEA